jgi:voltage-gated potassium channel
MRGERLYTLLEKNPLVIPVILVLLIIFFGGIAVYLAEHKQQGANITNLGDAFWWTIVTITTVGYGEYYPLTLVGRAVGIFVMFSGISIVVIIVGIISQRRIKSIESRTETVNDFMRKSLITIEESSSVQEAANRMKDKNISSLVVVDEIVDHWV